MAKRGRCTPKFKTEVVLEAPLVKVHKRKCVGIRVFDTGQI